MHSPCRTSLEMGSSVGRLGQRHHPGPAPVQQTPEEAMTDAAEQVRALIQGALAGMVNLPGSYQDFKLAAARPGTQPARQPP
jgi:hypothetical protein